MSLSERSFFSRGNSIPAALVLVAVLGVTVVGLSELKGISNSRSLVSATGVAVSATRQKVELREEKKGHDKRCETLLTQAKGAKEGREGLQNSAGKTTVCMPGCEYKIFPEGASTIIVQMKDTCKDLPPNSSQKKECEQKKKCVVQDCLSTGSCARPLGENAIQESKDQILGKAALVPEYWKDDLRTLGLLQSAKTLDSAEFQALLGEASPHIKDAFAEAADDARNQQAQAITNKYDELQRKNQEIIAKVAETYPTSPQVQALRKEAEALTNQYNALVKQNDNLTSAVFLGPKMSGEDFDKIFATQQEYKSAVNSHTSLQKEYDSALVTNTENSERSLNAKKAVERAAETLSACAKSGIDDCGYYRKAFTEAQAKYTQSTQALVNSEGELANAKTKLEQAQGNLNTAERALRGDGPIWESDAGGPVKQAEGEQTATGFSQTYKEGNTDCLLYGIGCPSGTKSGTAPTGLVPGPNDGSLKDNLESEKAGIIFSCGQNGNTGGCNQERLKQIDAELAKLDSKSPATPAKPASPAGPPKQAPPSPLVEQRIQALEAQLNAARAEAQKVIQAIQQQMLKMQKDGEDAFRKMAAGLGGGGAGGMGGMGDIGKLLSGMGGGGGSKGGGGSTPAGNQTPQTPGSCNPQYLCANNQLYYRTDRCVDQPVQTCQYGCSGNTCAANPTNPTNPDIPLNPATPTATISCQPQLADVGMSVAISYACSVGVSVGRGFDTGSAQSGSATKAIENPPDGASAANFGVTCSNQGRTATANCSVQINRPGIVLVANPKAVESGKESLIGWVTTGMQSCLVSSPEQSDFTSRNAGNTSVNGLATTSPVTASTDIVLWCQTLAGGTRVASTTVTVK